jgi:hypothetical protein
MLNAQVFKNKHPAVSHGARRFGKRSIFVHVQAFPNAVQPGITALGAVFQPSDGEVP